MQQSAQVNRQGSGAIIKLQKNLFISPPPIHYNLRASDAEAMPNWQNLAIATLRHQQGCQWTVAIVTHHKKSGGDDENQPTGSNQAQRCRYRSPHVAAGLARSQCRGRGFL